MFAEQVRQEQSVAVSPFGDPEVHGLREAIKLRRAKESISVREAHAPLGALKPARLSGAMVIAPLFQLTD